MLFTKRPTIIFSHPRRILCRMLQVNTLLSDKHLSCAHDFSVRDEHRWMSVSHYNPGRLREVLSDLRCWRELFFSYTYGTDQRYILFKVTALDLNDICSFVSENFCSMRNLGQSYATKCVWLLTSSPVPHFVDAH
jgi:hypothetical protein